MADAPAEGVASQRAVLIREGRAGEVTTEVAPAPGSGVPTLSIAATGEDLGAAARALALTEGGDTLQLANDPAAEGLSGELGKREPDVERSLADLGAADVAVSGYGINSQLDPDQVVGAERPEGCVARRRAAYYADVATRGDLRTRLSHTTPLGTPTRVAG